MQGDDIADRDLPNVAGRVVAGCLQMCIGCWHAGGNEHKQAHADRHPYSTDSYQSDKASGKGVLTPGFLLFWLHGATAFFAVQLSSV
jgi:hypothetical protein